MKKIINTSFVTDYSGETPVVTYSNPVTTVIRQTPPEPVITRVFYCLPCDCCGFCNRCDWDGCGCDSRCGCFGWNGCNCGCNCRRSCCRW